jgi:hypothetical protein
MNGSGASMMPDTISHHISEKTPTTARLHPTTVSMMQNPMSEGDKACGGGKPFNLRARLGRNAAKTKIRAAPTSTSHPEGESMGWS